MTCARWITLLAALATSIAAGCGDVAWERGRVLLWWEPHEVLFALSPQRGRVDAYRLHGGVLWTGGLDLPAGVCFDALRFDPATARLWVTGADGGMLVDTRHMRMLARWEGEAPEAAPVATLVAGSAVPDACVGRPLASQAMPAGG